MERPEVSGAVTTVVVPNLSEGQALSSATTIWRHPCTRKASIAEHFLVPLQTRRCMRPEGAGLNLDATAWSHRQALQ